MPCPLCAAIQSRPSWFGATIFDDKQFVYRECLSCRSLFCDPMPDERALEKMYGVHYAKSFVHDTLTGDPRQTERVLALLAAQSPGVFLDYGCGEGKLLAEVKAAGWSALGLELNPEVAEATGRRVGVEVVSQLGAIAPRSVDVLHLGDVLEHLTMLSTQFPALLQLLKSGGTLISQGPLEAHANLFLLALRLGRTLKRSPPASMPPYHVLLATADGQRRFFARFGLAEIDFAMREVSWPAPEKLRLSDLRHARSVALYALRKLSQALSALLPRQLGNRYFFVGKATESARPTTPRRSSRSTRAQAN